MRTAIDTNVLSALWSGEPLASLVSETLDQAAGSGGLVVCGAVYAELLAHPKAKLDFVDDFLSTTGISIDFDLGEAVWRAASVRFAKYASRRRVSRGGSAKRLLADFIVGAHALTRSDRLFTLDPSVTHATFPSLSRSPAGERGGGARMGRMEIAVHINVELLPEGVFLGTSEQLPGLVAQGRTVAETLEIARDVGRQLIEAQRERDAA